MASFPNFRAWSEERKKMHYEPEFVYEQAFMLNEIFKNGFIWMQFTGLFDKNGKKIYEGDIIRGDKSLDADNWNDVHHGVVSYYLPECRFRIVEKRNCEFYVGFQQLKNIEIIGNVYENPELLKE